MVKNFKDNVERLIPMYGLGMMSLAFMVNSVTYFGTRLFTTNLPHHNISTYIDGILPFCPFFITIYFLAYVQWVVGFIMVARESKYHCYRYMTGEIIAKLICLVLFVVYPTTVIRPEINGDGIWQIITAKTYSIDAADNLFPSIHCLESWFCFRSSMSMKKVGRTYKLLMLIFALLVFASTVLVKQHVVIDIIGGIAVVEIGLFVSGKLIKKDRYNE